MLWSIKYKRIRKFSRVSVNVHTRLHLFGMEFSLTVLLVENYRSHPYSGTDHAMFLVYCRMVYASLWFLMYESCAFPFQCACFDVFFLHNMIRMKRFKLIRESLNASQHTKLSRRIKMKQWRWQKKIQCSHNGGEWFCLLYFFFLFHFAQMNNEIIIIGWI